MRRTTTPKPDLDAETRRGVLSRHQLETTMELHTRDQLIAALAAFDSNEGDKGETLDAMIDAAVKLVATKEAEWETVGVCGTCRLEVPGGWIYMADIGSNAGAMPVFVPAPPTPPKLTVDDIPRVYRDALELVQEIALLEAVQDDGEGGVVVNVTDKLASCVADCGAFVSQ